MSLLADLLSKRNNGSEHGKEIPPTLANTRTTSATSHSRKNRTVLIVAASVAAVGIGVFSATQFERLAALFNPPPVAPKPVEVAKVVPLPASPIVQAPPAAPPVEEVKDEPVVPPKPVKRYHKPVAKKPLAIKPLPLPKPLPVPVPPPYRSAPVTPPRDLSGVSRADMQARDALLYAARSAELAGDWRTALSCYRKAQKIDPENFKIMNNTAAALNNLGMFDEGVSEAKRALGKKPDYVPAMVNAAIAYSSTGNSLEALLLFSKASSADPTNRTLAINLGILQERTGKLDEAKLTYKALAEAGDPLALQGLARVYERMGKKGDAIRAYRQLMALPNSHSSLKKEAKERIMRLEE
jgi:Flp pilus assembly protein TadD